MIKFFLHATKYSIPVKTCAFVLLAALVTSMLSGCTFSSASIDLNGYSIFGIVKSADGGTVTILSGTVSEMSQQNMKYGFGMAIPNGSISGDARTPDDLQMPDIPGNAARDANIPDDAAGDANIPGNAAGDANIPYDAAGDANIPGNAADDSALTDGELVDLNAKNEIFTEGTATLTLRLSSGAPVYVENDGITVPGTVNDITEGTVIAIEFGESSVISAITVKSDITLSSQITNDFSNRDMHRTYDGFYSESEDTDVNDGKNVIGSETTEIDSDNIA